MATKTKLPTTDGAKIYLVGIAEMRQAPPLITQREFNKGWGDRLAKELELEKLGIPVLNHRDKNYWIVDGQHRIYALKERGFGEYAIDCCVFEDLTDPQMAQMFLKLNEQLNVSVFSKFHVQVTADDPRATAILRIVKSNGCKISRSDEPYCIDAISALGKVIDRGGDVVLGQTIRTLQKAFDGDTAAFAGIVIESLGMVYSRFNGQTNEPHMIERLAHTQSGIRGILRTSETYRFATGNTRANCVAAAIVDAYNRGKRGSKTAPRLPIWWKAIGADQPKPAADEPQPDKKHGH